MKRLAIVAVMATSLALLTSPAYGAARPVTFAGTCQLSGDVSFHPPLGSSLVETTATARMRGHCSGTLVDPDGSRREIDHATTIYHARAAGLASCAGGIPTGEGHLVIAGERIDFLFDERRATAVALITLTGLDGGTAAVVGRTPPDTDVVDTATRCTQNELSSVPVDFTLATTSISG